MTECSIRKMASELGKLGKGRKKRLSPEERARRVKAMDLKTLYVFQKKQVFKSL